MIFHLLLLLPVSLYSISQKAFNEIFSYFYTVQSFSRDLGSISSEDYTMLDDTKRRARELIIEWIFAAIDEDGPPGPPPEPLDTKY